MDFELREDADGVRVSWNRVPRSSLQHQRNVIPLGALYSPMNQRAPVAQCAPHLIATCRQCQAFMNPYSRDAAAQPLPPGVWSCVVCGFVNRYDPTPEPHPALGATTIEYATGRAAAAPPVYLYVVDTCFEGEDVEGSFRALQQSLADSVAQLPDAAHVGLVTFGQHVQVHEIGGAMQRQWSFNGAKAVSMEQLTPLGLKGARSRFLVPVRTFDYELSQIVATLCCNVFPHSHTRQRPNRCTGAALQVATTLLRALGTVGGHVYAFVGGVCTFGPGQVVGQSLAQPIRSHHDVARATSLLTPAAYHASSRAFYNALAAQLVAMGVSCSLLIGSYDQVGLFEMEALCQRTGGDLVMCDSYDTTIFRQSMVKLPQQQMCLNATLEVRTSPDLAVQGLLGNATSLPGRRPDALSKNGLGQTDTNCWKCCNVGPTSTFAVYLEKRDSKAGANAYVQFIFHYQPTEGVDLSPRVRVTTVPLAVVQDNDFAAMEGGFDQETALVLVAREFVFKMQAEESRDNQAISAKKAAPGGAAALVSAAAATATAATVSAAASAGLGTAGDLAAALDRKLIDFCARFAVYTKGSVESFCLASAYSMFPQFMFHLRRSQLVKVFNNSPDETSYVRHVFLHENLTNSLTIVQPTLLSYDVDNFEGEPEPVLLDSMSLGANKVLLLDTFFHVLIYHGSRVAAWRRAKYHEQEGYEYFREFLEAPKREAMEILVERFPLPRFIDCDEGGSQARFLMAKLNPSTSYSSHPLGGSRAADVLTDDVSLQSFMEHVQQVVVQK
ncbi:Protein transport protein SEC23 [[Candida] zeylanoides]